MAGAHSVEMISRMESDKYYQIEMDVQLANEIVNIRKLYRCVQSFKSDAGAGVMERWTPEPFYTTIEDKKGGFWFVDAPNCKKTNLSQYPSYIAHFSSQSDTYPKIYVISEDGSNKVVGGAARLLTEKPDNFEESISTEYTKENYYQLTPSFVYAYVSNFEDININETKLGIASDSEVSFIGSRLINSKNYKPTEFSKSISNKPEFVMGRDSQAYARQKASIQRILKIKRSVRIPLSHNEGVWSLQDLGTESSYDSFTKESREEIVIEYKGYRFSLDEIGLIYDPVDRLVISFYTRHVPYGLSKN